MNPLALIAGLGLAVLLYVPDVLSGLAYIVAISVSFLIISFFS